MKTSEELNLTMSLYSSLDDYLVVAVLIVIITAVILVVAFERIVLVTLYFL